MTVIKPQPFHDSGTYRTSVLSSLILKFKFALPDLKSSKSLLHFEEGVERELENLSPPPHTALLTWHYLQNLLTILFDTHREVLGLFGFGSNLSKSDEKLTREYLDDTVKILELCNAITAAISHLQCNLLYLRYALTSIENSTASSSHGDFTKAKEALDSYCSSVRNGSSTAKGVGILLTELSLSNSLKFKMLKKKKSSCKPLMHAWYDVHSLLLLTFDSISLALIPQEEGIIAPARAMATESDLSLFPGLESTVRGLLRLAKGERELRTSVLGLSEFATLNETVDKLLDSLSNAHPTRLIELTQDLREQLREISFNLDDVGKKISDYFHLIIHSRSVLVEALGNFGNSRRT